MVLSTVKSPSFVQLKASSDRASRVARSSSRKNDTKPELLLRRWLHSKGFRFRVANAHLPGRPDITFRSQRVAVFVDGDFWHGRDLHARLQRLSQGHNAGYWTAKIASNRARDIRVRARLRRQGWTVVRFGRQIYYLLRRR